MKKLTKSFITTTTLFISLSASAAKTPVEVNEGALLDNVGRTLEVGMKRVEREYTNNAALGPLPSQVILIASGTAGAAGGQNPYVDQMKIETDYILKAQLHATTPSVTDNTATTVSVSDVPATLSDIIIAMVPIYKADTGPGTNYNAKITGWECVTNADLRRNKVLGESAPASGAISFVAKRTNHNFLGNCRYLPGLSY